MDFELFVLVVAGLAVVYAAVNKVIQNKLIDKEAMKKFQEESKKVNEEYKAAQKSGNKKRIDEAMKKQMDMLPRMNKVMMGQMKPMFITIAIFMAMYWMLGQIDPTKADDAIITLLDDGSGCDSKAGDGTFTLCHDITATKPGRWAVLAVAKNGVSEIGANSTEFFVDTHDETEGWVEPPRGQELPVYSDKRYYANGETAMISVESQEATEVQLTIDQGTAFEVDLPVKIPVIEFQRIYHPPVWFIVISLLVNVGISLSMKAYKEVKK